MHPNLALHATLGAPCSMRSEPALGLAKCGCGQAKVVVRSCRMSYDPTYKLRLQRHN